MSIKLIKNFIVGVFLLLNSKIECFQIKKFKCPTSKTEGWHPIGFSKKITTIPQRVEFNNEDGGFKALVVWRTKEGEVLARPDVCPHLGYKLSKGKVTKDGCIQCPYHGIKVGPNAVIENAREMEGITCESNGLVWWNNDKNEKYNKFCQDIKNLEDIGSVLVRWDMEVKAGFSDCFRNGMDLHHAGWVHSSTFGNKLKDPDDIKTIWLDKKTMRADFNYYSNNNYKKVTGDTTENYHLFQFPSTTWNKVLNKEKNKYVFIHVAMRPTSPTTTHWYLTAGSNYMPEQTPKGFSEYFLEKITRQVAQIEDKGILENMENDDMKDIYSYKINLPLDEIYCEWYNGPPEKIKNDENYLNDVDNLLYDKNKEELTN